MAAILLCSTCLTGCGQMNSWQGSVQEGWQAAARSVLVSNAFDNGLLAVRDGNKPRFAAQCEKLRRLERAKDALILAASTEVTVGDDEVVEGFRCDNRAMQTQGAERDKWKELAAQHYRLAMRFEPNFDSEDPDKLNALGYYLADLGTTAADFELAAKLTQHAVAILDVVIEQVRGERELAQQLIFSRANIRDSYAWSLYKLGRYEPALEQQRRAVKEAIAANGGDRSRMQPDFYYHLGEMYRALQRPHSAQRQYVKALTLRPKDAPTSKAVQQLAPSLQTTLPETTKPADPDVD